MSDQQAELFEEKAAFISALTGRSVEASASPETEVGAGVVLSPARVPTASTHPAGRALKERGQALVDAAVDDEWKRHCDEVIERFAATGDVFTCEDVCEVVGRPDRANAVGARISAWARRKDGIVCTGFTLAKRPEAHSRVIRTWRGVAS